MQLLLIRILEVKGYAADTRLLTLNSDNLPTVGQIIEYPNIPNGVFYIVDTMKGLTRLSGKEMSVETEVNIDNNSQRWVVREDFGLAKQHRDACIAVDINVDIANVTIPSRLDRSVIYADSYSFQ